MITLSQFLKVCPYFLFTFTKSSDNIMTFDMAPQTLQKFLWVQNMFLEHLNHPMEIEHFSLNLYLNCLIFFF